jgi:hypothetical protein
MVAAMKMDSGDDHGDHKSITIEVAKHAGWWWEWKGGSTCFGVAGCSLLISHVIYRDDEKSSNTSDKMGD